MKAGSGLAQAQSKPFCTMYALVGTGAFIIWALLTVPTPTRTPNASNVDRIVLTPTATEANLWDINIAGSPELPEAGIFLAGRHERRNNLLPY